MCTPLLQVEGLKTYFSVSGQEVRAVDGVSLRIDHREAVGLVGESGCGKTTLAFSIMNMVPQPGKIISGRILLKGRNILDLSAEGMRKLRGKEISMIFQDPLTYLNPVINIRDQVIESIILHQGLGQRESYVKAIRLLETMQIPSPEKIMDSYPHQLSGGILQRCLLAIALSANPNILLADEPTTSLDVTVQAQIVELLIHLRSQFGMSVLLVTHDLGLVAELCDRVYVMYAGKILEYGNVYDMFQNCVHPYTKALMSSVLSIEEFKENIMGIPGMVPDLSEPPTGCRFHPRCSKAMPVCKEREPSLFESETDHGAACWLLEVNES